jgi:hypothetical protein
MDLRLMTRGFDLDEHVKEWIREGIVTSEQGGKILAAEEAPPVTPRRLSLGAEFAIYLGVVLVVASGGVFVSRIWQDIALGGRVGVGALVAVVGLAGGRLLTRMDEPGTTRLGWFLWFCGTAGVAMTTALLADRIDHGNGPTTMLWAGLLVAATSVALWRNLDRPLQFLSSVAGVVISAVAAVNVLHWHVSALTGGLVLWGASAALALLGATVVRPGLLAVLVGQFGTATGAMAIMTGQQATGLTLGLLAAVAGVAYGVRSHNPLVTGVGVTEFFIMTVRLLTIYLRGPIATLVSFLIGVALVVVTIRRVTHGHRGGPGPVLH